jgi:flagella basal body P-ring formation protein FlgA
MAIGQEAQVTLYAGRPIRAEDIGPPAIIERNQIVPLAYGSGGLSILTEGRAMARGGAGDVIRVMNLESRTTVTGQIQPDGTVSTRSSP